MFEANVYVERRKLLKEQIQSGVILILGNSESPMNYSGNPFHFRQDSSFIYFFGQDKPDFVGLIDIEEDKDYLFGEDFTVDDIIWMGPQPTVKELGQDVGIANTGSPLDLENKLKEVISQNRNIHFLPPYRAENMMQLEKLLGISSHRVNEYASIELIKAVVAQRSVKSQIEIKEIEKALDTSYEMYMKAMQMVFPGKYEREIVGAMEGIVNATGNHISFPTILTINGETLHNHYHGNCLEKGQLLVIDSGAESGEHYASDITRTFPVGGAFTPKQKDIYQMVLNAQMSAIEAIKPDILYKDIHLQVAKNYTVGLKEIGLMKGNVDDAVNLGAHALFFPHGLGHMLGLDIHDMEDLGENYVGYDDNLKRSDQFGLAYLRMARSLKPGFVITVEPGMYFIPALIDQWMAEKKFTEFINYTKVEEYRNFGGIRIEDDVLVTETGYKVLGKPIPKSIDEIEALMK